MCTAVKPVPVQLYSCSNGGHAAGGAGGGHATEVERSAASGMGGEAVLLSLSGVM